jgi:hypothetical protein
MIWDMQKDQLRHLHELNVLPDVGAHDYAFSPLEWHRDSPTKLTAYDSSFPQLRLPDTRFSERDFHANPAIQDILSVAADQCYCTPYNAKSILQARGDM